MLRSRRFVSLRRRKTNFHQIDDVCLWHAVIYHLRKRKPIKDYQKPSTYLLFELHQVADRARYEVCHHVTGPMTSLYIRAIQGHCTPYRSVSMQRFTMRDIQATNTVVKSTVFLQAFADFEQDGKIATGQTKTVLHHNSSPSSTDIS